MECHKFIINVAADTMSAIQGMASPQNRLYIPKKGVIGYGFYEENKIDCFLDDSNSIKEAEKIIKGKDIGKNSIGAPPNPNYIGKIELPEDKINEFIDSYETKEKVEANFQEKSCSLISLIK